MCLGAIATRQAYHAYNNVAACGWRSSEVRHTLCPWHPVRAAWALTMAMRARIGFRHTSVMVIEVKRQVNGFICSHTREYVEQDFGKSIWPKCHQSMYTILLPRISIIVGRWWYTCSANFPFFGTTYNFLSTHAGRMS